MLRSGSELGRISKTTLDKINKEIKSKLEVNQWKNTKGSVISVRAFFKVFCFVASLCSFFLNHDQGLYRLVTKISLDIKNPQIWQKAVSLDPECFKRKVFRKKYFLDFIFKKYCFLKILPP